MCSVEFFLVLFSTDHVFYSLPLLDIYISFTSFRTMVVLDMYITLPFLSVTHLILSRNILTWQRSIHLVAFAYIYLRRFTENKKEFQNLSTTRVVAPAKKEQYTTCFVRERAV